MLKKFVNKIQERAAQRNSAYKSLMQDASVSPITVGQVRKVCHPHQPITIYKRNPQIEYLVTSKANLNIDNRFDGCKIRSIESSPNSPGLSLEVR